MAHIKRGEFLFVHKAQSDRWYLTAPMHAPKQIMSCCETRWQGPWQVFHWFVLPPKFFAKVAVTFFGFATVLSTCCCTRQVKQDDRVFQLFVLPPNYFDKVAVTYFDYAIMLSPCCIGQLCLRISLLKWLSPCLTMWQCYCLVVGNGIEW